jgi:hypothetical protein
LTNEIEGEPISVLYKMVRINGEVWVYIKTVAELTNELRASVMFPLDVFDNMVRLRNKMVQEAEEMDVMNDPMEGGGSLGMGG